jgi:ribosomal protein S27E
MTAAIQHATEPPYERRRPERSALYQVILRHLQSFLAVNEVPSATAHSLKRFLRCGLLAAGFVRVRCPECHKESLVAFSCKDRGFCPSCTARRAAQTAANLVYAYDEHRSRSRPTVATGQSSDRPAEPS